MPTKNTDSMKRAIDSLTAYGYVKAPVDHVADALDPTTKGGAVHQAMQKAGVTFEDADGKVISECYLDPDKVAHRKGQQWAVVGDHFLRFDDPDAVPIPHHAKHALAGLDHTDPDHTPHYDWEWPAEEIVKIYEGAVK